MANNKQTNDNAEVKRGKDPVPVSQRGKIVKKTCVQRIARNFLNTYIVVTGISAAAYARVELPGDWGIHAMWGIGVTAGACCLIAWWLSSHKRE